MDKNNYKMSIKARVNCPYSVIPSMSADYDGQTVTIIDFIATAQGLVAIGLVEKGDVLRFAPFAMKDLEIVKE